MTLRDLDRLDAIYDLADQIYAEASWLDKGLRHPISDAASLVMWLVVAAKDPEDAVAKEALAALGYKP